MNSERIETDGLTEDERFSEKMIEEFYEKHRNVGGKFWREFPAWSRDLTYKVGEHFYSLGKSSPDSFMMIERCKEMQAEIERLKGELHSIVDELIADGGITESTPNANGQLVSTEPSVLEMVRQRMSELSRLQSTPQPIESLQQQLKTVTEELDKTRDVVREHIQENNRLIVERDRLKEESHPIAVVGEDLYDVLCDYGMSENSTPMQAFWFLKKKLRELSDKCDWTKQQIEAKAGPPSQEVIESDYGAMFVVRLACRTEVEHHCAEWIESYVSACGKDSILWHIGPIIPPKQEPELPKCPWWHCDGNLYIFKLDGDGGCCWKCDKCVRESSRFETEAEAIEAARSAGKGE